MAATITLKRVTGSAGAPTETDIKNTTTRASLSDNPAPGTANGVVIPQTSTGGYGGGDRNYSWWVTTRLKVDVAPTGELSLLTWYTTGAATAFGTGTAARGQSATSYVQAVTGGPRSGLPLTQANHAGLTAATVVLSTFTASAPKVLASGTFTGTGYWGDYMVWQIEVTNTAVAGTSSGVAMFFRYDET